MNKTGKEPENLQVSFARVVASALYSCSPLFPPSATEDARFDLYVLSLESSLEAESLLQKLGVHRCRFSCQLRAVMHPNY